MAVTKTYKGKKNGYYPETPGRHQGGDFELLVGPIDKTVTLGMQREPVSGYSTDQDQFGRKTGKSEAD